MNDEELTQQTEQAEAPEPTAAELVAPLAEKPGAEGVWWKLVEKCVGDARDFDEAVRTAGRKYPRAHQAMIDEANQR